MIPTGHLEPIILSCSRVCHHHVLSESNGSTISSHHIMVYGVIRYEHEVFHVDMACSAAVPGDQTVSFSSTKRVTAVYLLIIFFSAATYRCWYLDILISSCCRYRKLTRALPTPTYWYTQKIHSTRLVREKQPQPTNQNLGNNTCC